MNIKILIFFCCFLINTTVFCSITEFNDEEKARITNSMIWGAVGDALGASVEFEVTVNDVLDTQGYDKDFLENNFESVITNTKKFYQDNKYNFDKTPYTDDTRMSLLVFQELQAIDKESENLENIILLNIANAFKKDYTNTKYGWAAVYRAPGNSTVDAINELSDNPKTVDDVLLPQLTFENPANDETGGGCGSVMHAAPFGYFKDFLKFAGKHSMITHNHPIAIASFDALAYMIGKLLEDDIDSKDHFDEVINATITIARSSEGDAVPKDDIDKNRYVFRMEKILTTALNAAKDMAKIREEIIKDINTNHTLDHYSNHYLIPFHKLMNNKEFASKHKAMFPNYVSQDYNYGTPEFIGKDAATCLAAALYNLYLWIPSDINDLTDDQRFRCLTNAITSAIVTGGDSDSIASITGQLCGAFVKKLTLPPQNVLDNLEDYEKIINMISNGAPCITFKNKIQKKKRVKSSMTTMFTTTNVLLAGFVLLISGALLYKYSDKIFSKK